MVLRPRFYLADIQTGDFHGSIPLEDVNLGSSLQPGAFQAKLDLRRYGAREGRTRAQEMAEGRALRELLRGERCTLVPVLEGLSTGAGNAPTSIALGEWWVSKVSGLRNDPVITLGGPEFPGYAAHVLLTRAWIGDALDPVVTAREMLQELYTTSQTIQVDLQSWVSHTGARVPVDARTSTTDYWSAIAALQDAEDGPFEWTIRTGLVMQGWSPIRVTRTLDVGQPTLAVSRPGVTLSLKNPGEPPASILSASWSSDGARSATTVYGFGAGAGDDQVRTFSSRNRITGEPVKTRLITVRDAATSGELRRHTRAALGRMTPTNEVFTALMATEKYTPKVGEAYTWRQAPSWTHEGGQSTVRCVGWSWQSGQSLDAYTLQLTEA